MDLYARKIIAWALANTMEVSTVVEKINKAKACRNTDLPLIIHSDLGSQYVSNAWRKATEKISEAIPIVVILTIMPASNLFIP